VKDSKWSQSIAVGSKRFVEDKGMYEMPHVWIENQIAQCSREKRGVNSKRKPGYLI